MNVVFVKGFTHIIIMLYQLKNQSHFWSDDSTLKVQNFSWGFIILLMEVSHYELEYNIKERPTRLQKVVCW